MLNLITAVFLLSMPSWQRTLDALGWLARASAPEHCLSAVAYDAYEWPELAVAVDLCIALHPEFYTKQSPGAEPCSLGEDLRQEVQRSTAESQASFRCDNEMHLKGIRNGITHCEAHISKHWFAHYQPPAVHCGPPRAL